MTPQAPLKPCPFPLCPSLTAAGGYCDKHRKHRASATPGQRSGGRHYDLQRWRKLRKMVLRRQPLCVDPDGGHPGEMVPATQVDHILSLAQGGSDEMENLQALCASCHSTKTAREKRLSTGSSQVKATVVCGPPGSGKSYWVNERLKWGDLVLDLDLLFEAISGLPMYEKPHVLYPFVAVARDAIIDRLTRGSDIASAWVITSGPDVKERDRLRHKLGAAVVVLEVPPHECMRRIKQDPRRKHNWKPWGELVKRWWKNYERSELDHVLGK